MFRYIVLFFDVLGVRIKVTKPRRIDVRVCKGIISRNYSITAGDTLRGVRVNSFGVDSFRTTGAMDATTSLGVSVANYTTNVANTSILFDNRTSALTPALLGLASANKDNNVTAKVTIRVLSTRDRRRVPLGRIRPLAPLGTKSGALGCRLHCGSAGTKTANNGTATILCFSLICR